jgi:hypothetical protein
MPSQNVLLFQHLKTLTKEASLPLTFNNSPLTEREWKK